MIIEVDDNTKESKVYSSLHEFCAAHSEELSRFLLTQFDTYIEEIAISGSLMEGDLVGNN